VFTRVPQRRHRVQARADGRGVAQRVRDPGAQQPRAERRQRVVQQPQQRPGPPPARAAPVSRPLISRPTRLATRMCAERAISHSAAHSRKVPGEPVGASETINQLASAVRAARGPAQPHGRRAGRRWPPGRRRAGRTRAARRRRCCAAPPAARARWATAAARRPRRTAGTRRRSAAARPGRTASGSPARARAPGPGSGSGQGAWALLLTSPDSRSDVPCKGAGLQQHPIQQRRCGHAARSEGVRRGAGQQAGALVLRKRWTGESTRPLYASAQLSAPHLLHQRRHLHHRRQRRLGRPPARACGARAAQAALRCDVDLRAGHAGRCIVAVCATRRQDILPALRHHRIQGRCARLGNRARGWRWQCSASWFQAAAAPLTDGPAQAVGGCLQLAPGTEAGTGATRALRVCPTTSVQRIQPLINPCACLFTSARSAAHRHWCSRSPAQQRRRRRRISPPPPAQRAPPLPSCRTRPAAPVLHAFIQANAAQTRFCNFAHPALAQVQGLG